MFTPVQRELQLQLVRELSCPGREHESHTGEAPKSLSLDSNGVSRPACLQVPNGNCCPTGKSIGLGACHAVSKVKVTLRPEGHHTRGKVSKGEKEREGLGAL